MAELVTEYLPAQKGGVATLRVLGTATWEEAPKLRGALFEAIEERGPRRLNVDLAGVERMDTAGLAVIIEGMMATRKRRPRVDVVSPSPSVEKVFQLASFVSLMSQRPDTRFYDALRRCCGDDPLRREAR